MLLILTVQGRSPLLPIYDSIHIQPSKAEELHIWVSSMATLTQLFRPSICPICLIRILRLCSSDAGGLDLL